jgi:hypothetical protein
VDIQFRAFLIHNVHYSPPYRNGRVTGYPSRIKFSLACFPNGSDRRWCLRGILDHTGGPARSASIRPISDVAPALLAVYPFSCAVVRPGA